jgi:hypothetical protein
MQHCNFFLLNVKGSHIMNEKKRNEVKDPVAVQEGKYRYVSTHLF